MIDSPEARDAELALTHMAISYPTSVSGKLFYYKKILLNLADFALQEQPEDSLMVAISRTCYNGSHTMAAEPVKSLRLHYCIQ